MFQIINGLWFWKGDRTFVLAVSSFLFFVIRTGFFVAELIRLTKKETHDSASLSGGRSDSNRRPTEPQSGTLTN